MKLLPFLLKLQFLLIGVFYVALSEAQVGQIIWEEDFNSFNSDVWNVTTGDGCPDLCGWGNAELEYYANDNVGVEEITEEPGNYALVIEAKSESIGGKSFTSGKVTTKDKLAIKYGMIEVRMKVPDVEVGLWPAVWLLGTNDNAVGWPQCGEIDIMEMGQDSQFRTDKGIAGASENEVVGSNLLFYSDDACADDNQTCAASIAYDNYYCTPYKASTPLNDRFVIYRVYWDDNNIQFTVEDNGVTHSMYTGPFPLGDDASEFNKPFYMILNLAVGGNFTDASTDAQVTAPLPGKMYIDYIRVRKWNGKGEISTSEGVSVNAGGDIKVAVNDTVTLNGAGSFGDIQRYEWHIADSIVSSNIEHKLVLPSGIHIVTLKAFDADDNAFSDEIKVQVGDEEIGEIIWEENFDNFNSEIWNTVTGDGCPDLCGWGNAELEYYQSDNVSIEEIAGETGNSALVLEAKSETVGSSSFTSGKITTENKLAIKYGVMEVRMKAPDVESGLWPAAWLLGINHNTVGWPQCGEIDMMEMGQSDSERERQGHAGVPQNKYVGANLLWYESGACASDNQTCVASIAYDTWYDKPYVASTPLNERFVIYRTYWDESQIRLTVEDNGVEYDLYEAPFPIGEGSKAFRKPFFFILNLAVGGRFTDILTADGVTAPLPAKMYVDYVRVRKWKGKGEVAFVNGEALADAGTDQALVDEDKDGVEAVTLDASNSYGNIATYDWSEGGAQIAMGENPIVELTSGIHHLTLTVTDSSGFVSTDEVKIDVREIIWDEEFNSFNSDLWNVVEGDGCPDLCGWGNAELEYYKNDNVYTEELEDEPGNYALVLEAKSETQGSSSFTSGKVTTQENMSVRYGLVEVRMQVPDLETGLWPAAWMLGINQDEVGWPQCGEIDIMEMGQKAQFREDKGIEDATENHVVGSNLIFYADDACSGENPNCAASIAYDNYYCTPYSATTPLNTRFVTYRTYWDDLNIRFTVEDNGQEYDLYTGPFPLGSTSEEFHKPFYFLLNLAVGGNFTDAATVGDVTATMPAKMLIDYVRVMKWNGKGEVDFYDGLIANAGTDILVLDDDSDRTETVVLDGTGSISYNGEIASYSWTENGVEIATGATPSVDFSRSAHKVFLTITDGSGNTETDSVLVVVSSGGLAPTADAGNDTILYDDNGDDIVSYTLDGAGSFDSNDTIIAYSWIENDVEIATGVSPTVSLSTGHHYITLLVYNTDSISDSDEVYIQVIDPNNNAPIANAGADQTVNDDNDDDLVTISFDASASSDSDGSIETYTWTSLGAEIATGVSPTIELSTGVYNVILEVMDNDGDTASDTVVIAIIDPDNVAPIAIAGADTMLIDSLMAGTVSFTLDASQSSDSDGTIDNYSWIENDAEIASGVLVDVDFNIGVHSVILKATDNDGVFSYDTISINVNQLPIAYAGADTILVDENSDGSESYTLDATGSYDANGTITSYLWMLGETELSTAATSTQNFNIGANVLTLSVTDNYGSTANDELLIFVARTNNAAPTADAGEDLVLQDDNGNGELAVQLDGSASSDSDGSIFSYTWIQGDSTEIATGVSPTVVLPIGVHQITLLVTDNEGATSTDKVSVTVTKRTNLALNKTTVTSSDENAGTAGSNAVDGDEATRWSSSFADPQWIYVDLGDQYMITQVILIWEAAFGSAYKIQISNDASSWTTIYTETAGDGGTDQLSVSGTGRYVRVYGTVRGTEYGYSLFELEVYGMEPSAEYDATLSDLLVDGVSIDGFSSSTLDYTYTLASGTTTVPEVTYVSSNPQATVAVTPAASLPGTTTLEVVSENEEMSQIYSVEFVYGTSINESLSTDYNIKAYAHNDLLYLNSDESFQNGKVELYNLMGIKILDETILSKAEMYNLTEKGILIVRVWNATGDVVVTKKMFVE